MVCPNLSVNASSISDNPDTPDEYQPKIRAAQAEQSHVMGRPFVQVNPAPRGNPLPIGLAPRLCMHLARTRPQTHACVEAVGADSLYICSTTPTMKGGLAPVASDRSQRAVLIPTHCPCRSRSL